MPEKLVEGKDGRFPSVKGSKKFAVVHVLIFSLSTRGETSFPRW